MAAPKTRWTSNIDGECVPDPDGRYETEEECKQNSQATDNKDVDLLIYEFNPSAGANLPPKYRIQLLRNVTGIEVSEEDSQRLLLSMTDGDLDNMAKEPILYPYLSEAYPEDEYIDSLLLVHTLEAVLELDRLNYFGPYLRDANIRVPQLNADTQLKRTSDLFRRSGRFDRCFYIYFEEKGDEDAIERIVDDTNDCNPDLIDYLTDVGKRFHVEILQNYTQVFNEPADRPSSVIYDMLDSTAGLIIKLLLQKEPEMPALVESCALRLLQIDHNSYEYPTIFKNGYSLLVQLAEAGFPRTKEWCHSKQTQLYNVSSNYVVELTISGILPTVERMELIAKLTFGQYRGVYRDTPESEKELQIMDELSKNLPEDYVPNLDVVRYFMIPGRQGFPFEVEDSQVEEILRQGNWYSDWIDGLKDKSYRMRIRKLLG